MQHCSYGQVQDKVSEHKEIVELLFVEHLQVKMIQETGATQRQTDESGATTREIHVESLFDQARAVKPPSSET